MEHPLFQLNKARRLINTRGRELVFVRYAQNEFHEPTVESVSLTLKGVYHETTGGHMSKVTADAATIRQKTSPMFLCLWEEAQSLLHTDQTEINGRAYRINNIHNIGQANLVADISLEEIQDG